MSISEEAKYACDFERMMNIGAPFSTLIASNNDKSNATVLKSYIRASIAQLDEELRERVKKTIHDTNEYSITVLDGRGLSKEQLDELFKYVHEDERIYSKKQAILERKA